MHNSISWATGREHHCSGNHLGSTKGAYLRRKWKYKDSALLSISNSKKRRQDLWSAKCQSQYGAWALHTSTSSTTLPPGAFQEWLSAFAPPARLGLEAAAGCLLSLSALQVQLHSVSSRNCLWKPGARSGLKWCKRSCSKQNLVLLI